MKKITVGIIGNPNSGKSTVFNALTGAEQLVGNWPGVTVERKSGILEFNGYQIEIVDLPGTYDLTLHGEEMALDEKIAIEYMLSDQADLIINVLDANNLERNLYLTTQLVELEIPMMLAVNMTDVAKKRGIKLDINMLAKTFGCFATELIAHKKIGIKKLIENIISTYERKQIPLNPLKYSPTIIAALKTIKESMHPTHQDFLALRLLESDHFAQQIVDENILSVTKKQQDLILAKEKEEADIIIADVRYGTIHKIMAKVVTIGPTLKTTLTAVVDRFVLNRILGIPIFLLVIYLLFFFTINIAGIFQDFFQLTSNAIFTDGFAQLMHSLHFPYWLVTVLATGVGRGINTTLTFIPVLSAMFLFLAILEASGYMARAGFVVDRVMCAIGLPGKSFVPMLIGLGCNVPAILAARTLENQRDRILTILMTPFMSCGARLAIYAIFTAAFFPEGGQNIVFILYLIGIIFAVLTGLVLRKTLLQGQHSTLIMELPPYHLPTLRNVCLQTWLRLKSFIFKAGKIIVPVCLLISFLNTFNIDGTVNIGQTSRNSLLASVGKTITPVLYPIGIKQSNWPATVGLIVGVMAKEVVVGTLNTLYAETKNTEKQNFELPNFRQSFANALMSIPNNIKKIGTSLTNPFAISAQTTPLHEEIYGQMYKRFDGKIGAFAYLLFVLLYFPCIPAIASIFKELDWRWATFSIFWNTGIAFTVATVFYQVATFSDHAKSSSAWIGAIIIALAAVIMFMRNLSKKTNKQETNNDTI